MIKTLERKGKKKKCPHCFHEFKYSWLSLMNRDWVSAYSNDSKAVLVTSRLNSLMTNKFKLLVTEGEFEAKLKTLEESKGLSQHYNFSIRNEMRCPRCDKELTSRSNANYNSLLNSKLFYLDGMEFINDKGMYKISIVID